MPELLVELFCEEIPSRMQAGAAAALARLLGEALAPLSPAGVQTFDGPRRIALAATLAAQVPASSSSERGPRASAPPQALDGFLRKHGATRDELREDGGHWVLTRSQPAMAAADLVARAMPVMLAQFPWPKSMRWGTGSAFTWVRPLRRIICVLDGAVVPFALASASDDGHGLVAGNQTEGHRFHAPGAFVVRTVDDWRAGLLARHVVPDAAERRARIEAGLQHLAAVETLVVVPDAGLLDEVAGLVEWPVVLLGRIDEAYMDLPPEVMQVSMRVNQRYFTMRTPDGATAPRFGFAANIEAVDGGAAIVAGNERVLRARFSDARHFWDLDRRSPLAERIAALDGVTFHAKLGFQGDRARRIEESARRLAPLVGADPGLAARAGLLAKADLTTGMVGEFPELQGVMGGYYATHDGEDTAVAAAVRDHYLPRGPADTVPAAGVTVAVALADKIDQLAGFFAVGEAPSGSGDPFALRRAALGVIRIIVANGLRLPLRAILAHQVGAIVKQVYGDLRPRLYVNGETDPAVRTHRPDMVAAIEADMAIERTAEDGDDVTVLTDHGLRTRFQGLVDTIAAELMAFVAERLRVQQRAEGARHDVLAAVFAAGRDDDLVRVLARSAAVAGFLRSPDGTDLLAASRRAANILRIEDKKDGPHCGVIDQALLDEPAEQALASALDDVVPRMETALAAERFNEAMVALAALRPTLDAFFDQVTVNAPDPALRRNRLHLLARLGAVMDRVADFSRIEG